MYPEFARIAREEGNNKAAVLFEQIARVESHHRDKYRKLLSMVENDTVYKREKPVKWKCLKCGYVHEGNEPPQKCPCCQHPREYFEPETV
jgi:rubrerythrin